MRSILSRFEQWVERAPDQLLYAFLDINGAVSESCTYAQFHQRTIDIAAHFTRRSTVRPGDRVLLAYPPGIEVISAFFACVRLGLIPVPAYPPAGSGFHSALLRTDYIARDCGAAAVLTDRAFYWSMRVNETRHAVRTFSFRRSFISKLDWVITTDAVRGTEAEAAGRYGDVLFLQYTSGSTTQPKGVMVTHDNILDNCEAVVDHRPVGVSWLPQYHDMGLIGYYIFFALKGGTTYGFSPVDFIRRPALWLETISRYGGTASSAPNFAYAYCLRPDKISDEAVARFDLRSLRFLMNAAEPVRPDVCRAFLRRFVPCGLDPRSFFAAYGLAEYTLAVSNYGRALTRFDARSLRADRVRLADGNAAADTVTELASCGRVLGNGVVRIVDVSGVPRPAGDGCVGEIWIRGPSKCRGYWQRPALSAAVFEARLPEDDDPEQTWLRSGDMGFLHEGELYVCGRLKDMLIVRGSNFFPQDIEAVIEEDAGVRKGCVAAFAHNSAEGELLIVVAESRRPRHLPDARILNERLLEKLGITASTFVFIAPRSISKTSSGKIARHVVREMWLANRLDVLEQVEVGSGSEAESAGQHGWLARFGLTGTETWTLASAGFDSLRLVEFSEELKYRLEEHGEKDLANTMDVQVIQRVAICELMSLFDQVISSTPHARDRLKRALADVAEEHSLAETEMMLSDARLRFEVAATSRDDSASGGILLTGATGFFGPFLLTSLLHQCSGPIHVLIRPNGRDDHTRIRDALTSVTAQGTEPAGWQERIRVIRGDLSAPRLGLDAATWNHLAAEIDTIYHNGAVVNYLLDYEAMRAANVSGTGEVLRLAGTGRAKTLNHISTTFIFGWSVTPTLFETDTNSGMDRLDFGYSQTKWVAEQLVGDAMRQGLDARIFRPALLTPSLDGGGYNFDIAVRLLSFMVNHGISTNAQNQVSFVPADHAAANIVAISQVPESAGGTFHVTRDEHASMADITGILSDLTGTSFTTFTLPDFVPEVIQRCHSGDILFPLLQFLVHSVDNITAMEFKRYDNSQYRRFRDSAPHALADPPLRDVVNGMLRFMRRHNLVRT